MTFRLRRYRFHFRAGGQLFVPAGKAGNLVRGAFGIILRDLACDRACPGARDCPKRDACAYTPIFEPHAGDAPSGFADPPRPFVIRASALDGRRIAPGERFSFDMHLFDWRTHRLDWFIRVFERLAVEGFGPGRAPAVLLSAEPLDGGLTAIDLAPPAKPVHSLTLEFVSPTELKSGGGLVSRPEFGVLLARARDRISTLSALYGEGPLDIDFTALAARAARVRLVAADMHGESVDRFSTRTRQSHPLGGFMGRATYEGDLGEFVPYLLAAGYCGVGRQTVWGKGEIRVR